MLSTQTLTRTLAAGDGVRLVRELERNGLPLGPSLAARLARGWVTPAALGFRRLLEVSHRPSRAAQAMLGDLLDAQDAGGGWVDPDAVDGAVATAAALRAFAAARGDRRFMGDRDRLGDAIRRGVEALRRRQTSDGWFGEAAGSVADRVAASVLVYWLVSDEPSLHGAVDVPALEAAWVDGGPRRGGPVGAEVDELWRLARAFAGDAVVCPVTHPQTHPCAA